MERTQIQLTKEQSKKLRELSLIRHESMASLIRKSIDQFLLSGKQDISVLYRRAEPVVGKHQSVKHDISIDHDRYLSEDFKS